MMIFRGIWLARAKVRAVVKVAAKRLVATRKMISQQVNVLVPELDRVLVPAQAVNPGSTRTTTKDRAAKWVTRVVEWATRAAKDDKEISSSFCFPRTMMITRSSSCFFACGPVV
jgi:hypothetical protein